MTPRPVTAACVPDPDVRAQHHPGRLGQQPRAVQNVQQQPGVICGGSLQRRSRVSLTGLPCNSGPAEIVVGSRAVLVEAPFKDEAGAGHPERSADQANGKMVQLFACSRLNHLLKIKIALSEIAEALARMEIALQGQVFIAPVWQACAMTEDVPGRDCQSPIVGRVVARQVSRQWTSRDRTPWSTSCSTA